MPGLFGFVDFEKSNMGDSDRFIKKMMQPLMHLNHYQTSTYCQNSIGAGTVSFPEGWGFGQESDIWTVYFGDIYKVSEEDGQTSSIEGNNYATIIIELYKKYGEKLPQKLNGSFNIFIHDNNDNVSYLFNDRFGFKHLYLYQDEHVFMFSPEIKVFQQHDQFDKTLNPHGISDYFVYFYHLSDRTFFRNVRLMPPASSIKIIGNKVSVNTYWHPVYSNEKKISDLQESIEIGYRLFEQSVDRCIGNKKKILVPLSGGLDSRLIVSVAAKRSTSITTATFGTSKCLDYRLASKVCNAIGISKPELISIESAWLQQYAKDLVHVGECSYGALGVTTQHGMAQCIRDEFEIALNGIYGGHISFGSPYYNQADIDGDYSSKNRIDRIRRGFNGHRYELLKNALSKKVKAMVREYSDETISQEWERAKAVSDQYVFRQDYIFIYNRIRRGMNNINQNAIFFNDKQPFASYELFDFYITLSPELAANHFLYKEIFKNKLPILAKIPWQNTGLNLFTESSKWLNLKRSVKKQLLWYIPRISGGHLSLLDHDKYDNQDVAYLKNQKLQNWIAEILLSERCLDRGYYSRKGILDLISREKSGNGLFHEIGKLVMFELWAREFIDKDVYSNGN